MSKANAAVNALSEQISKLQESITSMDKKLSSIDAKLDTTQSSVQSVKLHVNNLEQNQQQSCVRIYGLELPTNINNSPISTAKFVYESLRPILEVALKENTLPSIPSCFDLIDTAHLLPAKADKVPAIYVRFRSKLYCLAIMLSKGKYFKETVEKKFSITDDLTRVNAKLLKSFTERNDAAAAWFRINKVCYKLKSDPEKILSARATINDCSP